MIRVQSTPQLHGKPMYKSQEEQYDEIQLLRYRAADLRDDNQLLRAQLAKCREEISRRCRETERRLEDAAAKSDPGTSFSSSGVVVGGTSLSGLKLRLFRLEQVLRDKEDEVRKLRADTRTTRLQEMKLQVQVYYRELLRLRRQLTERRRNLGPGPSDPAAAAEARRLRRENRRLRALLGDPEILPEALRVKHQASSRTDLILTVESLEASVRRSEAEYQLVLKQSTRHQRAKEEQERRRQEEERKRQEEERRRQTAEQEREQYRSAVQRWKRETQAADARLQRQNAELLSRVGCLQEELLQASSSSPTSSSSRRRNSSRLSSNAASADSPMTNGVNGPLLRETLCVDVAVETDLDDVVCTRHGHRVAVVDVGLDPILAIDAGLTNGWSPAGSESASVANGDSRVGSNGSDEHEASTVQEQRDDKARGGKAEKASEENSSAAQGNENGPSPSVAGVDGEPVKPSGGTSAEDVIKTWVELQLQREQRQIKDKERVNWLAEIRRDLAARVLQRGWRAYKRRREIEMEDVVLSFRRRCAARRIAAGWQRYNNRKKLRQNLSTIRRLARGHLRRVALLEENATILALPGLEPAEPSIGYGTNHAASGPPSVGGAANYKSDAPSQGGAVNVAAAVRVVQSAVREVLEQAALVGDAGGDRPRS